MDEATNANAGAEAQAAEAGSAQDLDALLSEFDGKQPAAEDAATPDPKPDEYGKKAYEMLKAEQVRRHQEQFNTDIAQAVNMMKESVGRDLDEDILQGYLIRKAEKDVRIANAFQARFDNPDAWKSVVTTLGKQFAKSLGSNPDENASASVEAVRASVSSNSDSAPSDDKYSMEKLGAMSDMELQRTIRDYARNMK